MTETVLDAIKTLLVSYGIDAVREYPDDAYQLDAVRVCVGIESCKLLSPGCGDYLGTVTVDGTEIERYGYRCEMNILLDVFAPKAAMCVECFDDISAALGELPGGIRYRALACGETRYDDTLGCFFAQCRFICGAMLERTYDSDSASFADFTLKGALRNYGD